MTLIPTVQGPPPLAEKTCINCLHGKPASMLYARCGNEASACFSLLMEADDSCSSWREALAAGGGAPRLRYAAKGERILCPNGHVIGTWTADYFPASDTKNGYGYVDLVDFAPAQDPRGRELVCSCAECGAHWLRSLYTGGPLRRGEVGWMMMQILIEGEWRPEVKP